MLRPLLRVPVRFLHQDSDPSCLPQLPLSENKSISKKLGTRHRAGLGLSEVCDAVVIIISEETGDISVAQNGQLISMVDSGRLGEILSDLQKQEAASKGKRHEKEAV